jgi:hypothetical protein
MVDDYGQFEGHRDKHRIRLSLLDRYYIRSVDVRYVYSTDILPIFKNKKDKGVVNGMVIC